jgi:phosphatidylglycerol lysyltransferase
MAPLAGLENRMPASLWNRLGAFVFDPGKHFYHLQGLRRYKEKFHLSREPKYVAYPGGMALPRIFTNLKFLISWG